MNLQASQVSLRHSEDGKSFFPRLDFAWAGSGIRVVMGASGSGKSSFLKLLGSVWRPTTGRVLMNDQELWREGDSQPDPALLAKIGFAFQNNALFSAMTVLENVLFPARRRQPAPSLQDCELEARAWLDKIGLESSADLFPHQLSGGMQKRLALARALVNEPEFLFLDDPTAGLDPISSRKMGRLLESLLEGRRAIIVIVTNDPDRARDWGPDIYLLHQKNLLSIREDDGKRLLGDFL